MPRNVVHPILRRLNLPVAASPIAVAVVASMAKHGRPMIHAAWRLDAGSLTLAFILCSAHRAANAAHGLVILRALGEPVEVMASARVWLATEACRWLPGRLWSFGSRAVSSSRRGLDRLQPEGPSRVGSFDGFTLPIVVAGNAEVQSRRTSYALAREETMLLPASAGPCSVEPREGKAEFLNGRTHPMKSNQLDGRSLIFDPGFAG